MPQEHILGAVRLPPPDPYRARVPTELGGALAEPVNLNSFVPPLSRQYEINDETEKALRTISTALQTGDPQLYNFYIAGKPGVGKNTLLRQVAASVQHTDADGVTRQGIPYHQVDVVEATNFDDLIGGTVLENVGGVTVTRWKPGPVGAFLMHGTGVLAINEIVRQPKAATLLQSIMEDRELPIRTPDGGMVKVPIGDGIIVAMTGNPGSDRDPDRPGAAAFTRTIPIRMEDGSKEERARRAEIAYQKRAGSKSVVEPKAKVRPEVMQRDYAIKTNPLQKAELNAAVEFSDEIEQLIEARQVQARTGGGRPVVPGPRGLDRFIAIGKGAGDWRHALEMLKLYCSQDRELFVDEWKLVEAAFSRKFSLNEDGSWKDTGRAR
jgi:MoxR-like ATPase